MNKNIRIATKFDAQTQGERCPRCNIIFKDFLDIGYMLGLGKNMLWACIDSGGFPGCGTVFVPKKTRQEIKENLKILVARQMSENDKPGEPEGYEAPKSPKYICSLCSDWPGSDYKVAYYQHMKKHEREQELR